MKLLAALILGLSYVSVGVISFVIGPLAFAYGFCKAAPSVALALGIAAMLGVKFLA